MASPSDVNPDLRPILEMFAVQLRHPNVAATLSDWRGTLAKGMLHFGRKEALDTDIDFNTLIYTELNPTPAKSGRRITLEPKLELIGVISNTKLAHAKFHYMRNEMVIIRAAGRWDYFSNTGPLDLKIASEVTVRLPEGVAANQAASSQVLKEAGKLCFSWLVVNRMTHGGTA